MAAWGVRGGAWLSLGEEPVVRWVEDDAEARTARLGEDTAALLSLRDGDRVRVVVAVGTPYTDTNPGACCLSFANVRLQGTTNLDLELVPEELGSVESMAVLDMEGDGRDELLVTAYGSSLTEASRPQYTLLRSPSGDGFVAEPVPIPNDQPVWFSSAGESDGAPGDDLLFVHEGLRRLVRVTSRDGALVAEQAPAIDILQPPGNSWIVGAADGLLVIASDRGIGTARWPRDGTLGDVTEQERDAWPTLYLLGTGEDARIVEVTGTDDAAASSLGIRVFNLALDLELDIAAPQEMNDLWRATQSASTSAAVLPNFYPQMGPIPGGLPDGRAAFLGLGRLLEIQPGGDHVAREAASLAGGEVVGLAGPHSAWLAFGSGWFRGGGTWAWMGDPGFGEEGFPDDARVTVAPLEAVLESGADADPPVELAGATALDLRDGPMLFAGEDGFRATVSGEPGTLVVTSIGPQTQADEIGNGPLSITLDPGRTRVADREHDVSMIVVSPGGFARTFGWDLTVLSEPPEVDRGHLVRAVRRPCSGERKRWSRDDRDSGWPFRVRLRGRRLRDRGRCLDLAARRRRRGARPARQRAGAPARGGRVRRRPGAAVDPDHGGADRRRGRPPLPPHACRPTGRRRSPWTGTVASRRSTATSPEGNRLRLRARSARPMTERAATAARSRGGLVR